MFDYKAFGDYVRQSRLQRGIRQKDIHHRVGIPQPSLARIENARSYANLYTLVQIAEALNCDLVIQFVDKGERNG